MQKPEASYWLLTLQSTIINLFRPEIAMVIFIQYKNVVKNLNYV